MSRKFVALEWPIYKSPGSVVTLTLTRPLKVEIGNVRKPETHEGAPAKDVGAEFFR